MLIASSGGRARLEPLPHQGPLLVGDARGVVHGHGLEHHGLLVDGLRMAWIGDGNNVCNSMIIGCSKVGISMAIATPTEFAPNQALVKQCKKLVSIDAGQDPTKAAKNADIIVTDTFVSIHDDPKRLKKFLPKYQVNSALMSKAKKSCIFMHCLPAKRDQEVTSDVIDGPQSVIWDEAENRLHSQKALLVSLRI